MINSKSLFEVIESINHSPADIIARRLPQIRADLAGSDPDICRICKKICVNAGDVDGEIQVITFERECPKCNNYSLGVRIIDAKITCGDNIHEIKTPLGCYCVHCDGPLRPPTQPKNNIDVDKRRFVYSKVIGQRKVDHHVNYEPEAVIPVCSSCHGKIHGDADGYEPYRPEQKRKEWESDDV